MSGSGLLVLGIGNVLLGDEGVGVHVVRALGDDIGPLPAGTQLVDGGTLGIELLPLVEDADALVLVDAVALGAPAGTVLCIVGDAIEATLSRHVSPHQVGSADLIAVARLMGVLPERVALVGIQSEFIGFNLQLSNAVAAAVAGAAEQVREIAWQFVAEPTHA